MKPVLKLFALILVTNAVAFVSCLKDDESVTNNYTSNPPQPPPPLPPSNLGKTIKGRIVEYNSGIPIAGATVSLRPDYPNMNKITLTSDHTGAISFISSTNNIGHISVEKPGYWGLAPYLDLGSPVFFYPDSTQFRHFINGNTLACDSFVVKLFSVWNITLHIKDTSGSERNTGITIHGLFNVNGSDYKRYVDWIVFPPGIDTTIQVPVFANAENKFGIWKSDDDDYFIWVEIRSQIQYISYGTNTTVNIFY